MYTYLVVDTFMSLCKEPTMSLITAACPTDLYVIIMIISV